MNFIVNNTQTTNGLSLYKNVPKKQLLISFLRRRVSKVDCSCANPSFGGTFALSGCDSLNDVSDDDVVVRLSTSSLGIKSSDENAWMSLQSLSLLLSLSLSIDGSASVRFVLLTEGKPDRDKSVLGCHKFLTYILLIASI